MKTKSLSRSSDSSPHSAAALVRHRVSRSRNAHLWMAAALVAILTATAPAQVPQLINYQGRVAVEGVNFEGRGQFRFALVNTDAATTYWRNAPDTSPTDGMPDQAVYLTVTKGLYSVLLGDTSLSHMAAIQPSVWTHPDVRLRVWFDDGTHGPQLLSPDQRIAAAGYAMVAGGLAPGVTIPASSVVTAPPGMVLIPAGEFAMGNTFSDDTDITDATPVTVMLSNFYLAVNEVSQSQWQSVYFWAAMHGYDFSNVGAGKRANHPVQTVSWHDAVKWCNARSEREGLTPCYYANADQTTVYRSGGINIENAWVKWNVNGYRLPTEAEWEKAARGMLVGARYPWASIITQNLANYFGDTSYLGDLGPNGYNILGDDGSPPYTTPVGTFAPNGYGVHDMAGNVYEWCWDRYGTPYAGGTDPHGPASGSYRVQRGGSWELGASWSRTALRATDYPTNSNLNSGFRVARSSVP